MSVDSLGTKDAGNGGVLRAIGSVVSSILMPVILAVVFFLIVTPVGLVYRLISKDPMNRTFDSSKSYRVLSEKSEAKSLKKQY